MCRVSSLKYEIQLNISHFGLESLLKQFSYFFEKLIDIFFKAEDTFSHQILRAYSVSERLNMWEGNEYNKG